MDMRIWVKRGLIALVVIQFIFIAHFLYSRFFFGTMVLQVQQTYPNGYTVSIDGKKFASSGHIISARERVGEHTVVVSASGYKNDTKTVKVAHSAVVSASFNPSSLNTATQTLLDQGNDPAPNNEGVVPGYTVVNSHYFDNNTWLVGTVVPVGANEDGEINVLHLVGGKWQTVAAGISFDTASLQAKGVPADVVTYTVGL